MATSRESRANSQRQTGADGRRVGNERQHQTRNGSHHAAGSELLGSDCFRLGLIGTRLTQSFGAKVRPYGLSHKQIGLLAIVDAGRARSQREIASAMGVAPSLVVTIVDQLVAMGAVTRVRDTRDRRVQIVELTAKGIELLRMGVATAREVDASLRADLGVDAAASLDQFLESLKMLPGEGFTIGS